MKYTGMLAGAILGGRSRVLGAVVGGVLGYQVGIILERSRKIASRTTRSRQRGVLSQPNPNRYPEEEIVEAMRRSENEPDEQAAELEDIHRSVSGGAGKNVD